MYIIEYKSKAEHSRKLAKLKELKDLATELYEHCAEEHEDGYDDDEDYDEMQERSMMRRRGKGGMARRGGRYDY